VTNRRKRHAESVRDEKKERERERRRERERERERERDWERQTKCMTIWKELK